MAMWVYRRHIFIHESFQSVSHGIVLRYRGRRTWEGQRWHIGSPPLVGVHYLWWWGCVGVFGLKGNWDPGSLQKPLKFCRARFWKGFVFQPSFFSGYVKLRGQTRSKKTYNLMQHSVVEGTIYLEEWCFPFNILHKGSNLVSNHFGGAWFCNFIQLFVPRTVITAKLGGYKSWLFFLDMACRLLFGSRR